MQTMFISSSRIIQRLRPAVYTFFPLILVSVFLITACSDNDSAIGNNFTIGGKTYALDKGYAYLDRETEVNGVKTYTWVVYLLSDSIEAENRDFSGSGNAVVFTIYANNDSSFLPPDTYKASDSSSDEDGCAIYTYYNIDTSQGGVYEDIDDVNVTIMRSGNTSSDYTFTMTFSITLSDGAIVNGTYKGSVKNF